MGWGLYMDNLNKAQIDYSAESFSLKIFCQADEVKENDQRIVLTMHQVIWGACGAVYLISDPVIGAMAYTFGLLLLYLVKALKELDDTQAFFGGNLYYIYCAVHVTGWLTQFIGHGVFEQRAPALLSNALFIFIAPFFEMFEVVNSLTGYRQAQKEEYLKIVDADIAHHKLSKQKKIKWKIQDY